MLFIVMMTLVRGILASPSSEYVHATWFNGREISSWGEGGAT